MRVVTPWLDLPNVPDAWCRRLTACHAGAQTAGAFFPRPRHEITQVHDLALTALARGRVMVIYIDGLATPCTGAPHCPPSKNASAAAGRGLPFRP